MTYRGQFQPTGAMMTDNYYVDPTSVDDVLESFKFSDKLNAHVELNCKQGDMATIFYPGNPYDGMIVRCEEYIGNAGVMSHGVMYNYWRIDRLLPGQDEPHIADIILRPIEQT